MPEPKPMTWEDAEWWEKQETMFAANTHIIKNALALARQEKALREKAEAKLAAAEELAEVGKRELAEAKVHIKKLEYIEYNFSRQNFEICQTLGKALGYPWYKYNQRNFPGETKSLAEQIVTSLAASEAIADNLTVALAQALAGLTMAVTHITPALQPNIYEELENDINSVRRALLAPLAEVVKKVAEGAK